MCGKHFAIAANEEDEAGEHEPGPCVLSVLVQTAPPRVLVENGD